MHFLRAATTAACHSLSSAVPGWVSAGNGRHASGWRHSRNALDVSSFNVEISVLFHFPSSANEWNMKLKLIAPPSRENWFWWDKHTLMKEPDPWLPSIGGKVSWEAGNDKSTEITFDEAAKTDKPSRRQDGCECGKSEFWEKLFLCSLDHENRESLKELPRKVKLSRLPLPGFNAIYMFFLRPRSLVFPSRGRLEINCGNLGWWRSSVGRRFKCRLPK